MIYLDVLSCRAGEPGGIGPTCLFPRFNLHQPRQRQQTSARRQHAKNFYKETHCKILEDATC